ncbi:hypothetical protein HS088_TW22G00030 [Tripterygium wilfordii]|uniref:Uncharacterized protein n=1 Tax=Tripterygium wilfordii TaxID=458696 RepID=A0A7J7BWV3_TRIWF|nr:hypothetical protein HS088_TW22G00030 [Tripterygium wilfordii]
MMPRHIYNQAMDLIIISSSRATNPYLIEMATEERGSDVDTGTHKEGIQEHLNVNDPSVLASNETKKSHLGKALAHRALHASSTRRSGGSRKVRTNDTMALPSRLSKVTLADDADKY